MKLFKKIAATATALVVTGAVLLSFGGVAHADCWQYADSGLVTSQTPVFNNICNVPNIGSESDFVRIRQSSNGNPTDNQNNPNFTVGSLASACNDGDKFDLWNYVHNDAIQDFNDNGNGSAVAHNVQLALAAAGVGTTAKSFNFTSTVSASNAASVSDTVTLNCNGEAVQLSLVPSSVHVWSKSYGWQGLNDGAVNQTTPIGSPTAGDGNVWGCWDYRVIVVYEVQVHKVQPPAPVYTCDMFTIVPDESRKVKVTAFTTTAKNGATFKNAVVEWGDNSQNTTAENIVGVTHQYDQKKDATYTITATAHFTVNGADVTAGGPSCVQKVTFKTNVPPVVTPPTTTVVTTSSTTPKTLVNTGPGSVAALFAAATVAGTVIYRRMLTRRLND
jgi:hypothetical protein